MPRGVYDHSKIRGRTKPCPVDCVCGRHKQSWNKGLRTPQEVCNSISETLKKQWTPEKRRQLSEERKGTPAWNKGKLSNNPWTVEREKKYMTAYQRAELLRRYGLTEIDYDRMYQIQGGRCKICGKHQTEMLKRLFVDHDHAKNEIRGLLCNQCNQGLGFFKDNVTNLRKAIEYLEAFLVREDVKCQPII